MSSKKAIKQHYNKILRDREKRKKHFEASGALGSEREERSREEFQKIAEHNTMAFESAYANPDEVERKRLRELKSGKKISLGH